MSIMSRKHLCGFILICYRRKPRLRQLLCYSKVLMRLLKSCKRRILIVFSSSYPHDSIDSVLVPCPRKYCQVDPYCKPELISSVHGEYGICMVHTWCI